MPIGFLLCYAACCSEHQRAITHGVGRLLYLVKKNQPQHDLTQWNMNKIAVILQTTFSNVFSCKKNIALWFKFQWSLFLRVKLEWSQHWFRQWLGLIRGQAITWNYDDPLCFSIFSKWQVTLEGFLSFVYHWNCSWHYFFNRLTQCGLIMSYDIDLGHDSLPVQHKATIWTNAGLLSIGALQTILSEISIKTDLGNIGSGNGLLPDSTKSWPGPM